jgi:hypothetical protein
MKETISAIDLELLSLHWVKISQFQVALMGADGQPLNCSRTRMILENGWEKVSLSASQRGYEEILIYCEDGNRYPIPAYSNSSSVSSSSAPDPQENEPSSVNDKSTSIQPSRLLEIPVEELNLFHLENSRLATYINVIETTKKLYVNPAGANAQGMPPDRFLSINSCLDLNDPPEFERRMDLVVRDRILTAYENEAWRWYFDPEAGRFRLKRMKFIADFRFIRYAGQNCWLGQVLQADLISRVSRG